MFNIFLNHRAKTITSAVFILAITTLISKILGLLRIRIFTSLFKSSELDIYFAAFRIPDFLYNLLILGAISVTFIPLFAEYWGKDKERAWQFANNVICVFLIILILLAGALAIFAPILMKVVAPGFTEEKFELLVYISRIMFLSPILLGISNIFGSILQYFSRFLVYSLAPILYNLGIILGAVFLGPSFGIEGLAWGVILGAVMHFLIQMAAVFSSGFKFQPLFNFFSLEMRKIVLLAVPRIIGLIASQLNLVIITAIASTLLAGSITIFNISNDIQYIPISLFGISFAVATFPTLTKSFISNKKKEFLGKFTSAFSQVLFLTLPLSSLFFLLRAQLVRIIAGSEIYTWQDTRLTAACLGIFSISIFAQSLIPLLSRAFYSFQDIKTPVKIGILSILVNIIFAILFVEYLSEVNFFSQFFQRFLKLEGIFQISVIALPLAYSLSALLNFVLLFSSFRKKFKDNWERKLVNSFSRVIFLSIISGALCFGLLHLFGLFFKLETFWEVLLQGGFSGGISILFYLYSAKILKFPEYDLIFKDRKRTVTLDTEL